MQDVLLLIGVFGVVAFSPNIIHGIVNNGGFRGANVYCVAIATVLIVQYFLFRG